MVANRHLKLPKLVLAGVLTFSAIFQNSCVFFKKNTTGNKESELEAIHAMSNNIFGTNVQAYMWGLTANDLSEFQGFDATQGIRPLPVIPNPNPIPANPLGGPLGLVEASDDSLGEPAGVETFGVSSRKFYQCWYMAKTLPGIMKIEEDDLPRLFVERAEPVGLKFVNAEFLLNQLEKEEKTRRLLAFAMGVLPVAACGGLGMIQGWKNAAISSMLCNLGVAAFQNYTGQFKKGDVTWGTADAREQIQVEIKLKANKIQEVNWEVLDAIFKKVNSFDSDPLLQPLREKTFCPRRSPALVKYMGVLENRSKKP
jgi:hypothetical protein